MCGVEANICIALLYTNYNDICLEFKHIQHGNKTDKPYIINDTMLSLSESNFFSFKPLTF
jgi:hypothetical protein